MKKFTYFLGIAVFIYIMVQIIFMYPNSTVLIFQLYVPPYIISVTVYWMILKRNPFVCSSEHIRSLINHSKNGYRFHAHRLFRKNSDTSLWFAPVLNTIAVIQYIYLICRTRYYFRLFRQASR